MRKIAKSRNTLETNIEIRLNVDGSGKSSIDTGVGFFNHMMTLFAKHGLFDLDIQVKGDTDVDDHHTVEDIGITLGQAFAEALGEKRGIVRYGHSYVPMDETLARSVVDLGGRPYLAFDYKFERDKVGSFDTELVKEFLTGFSNSLACNIHIDVIRGENTHHIIEAIFKSLSRAISQAVSVDQRISGVMSTKGVI
ncbi:imidazoleglycerol-phosphate dehydratase HisB [Peptoclostridium acidaminophilum DSM 3953]|uniref:Imidazoleglycerol-phosphate dehydratase n=1 Tax=Peptoclostridium acidaminophilum DSM 3953 TaxID=1286171 RepID=W8TKK1_PEPAC|nr:imidazoleglycerol-phosphate dehydratase HisB [Peptoclostridium acidaminophilum]AHM56707.1 imidazoleglycerol-phosphate dehydratase HisB [Peptoclostridium acidaminophilum DSM 3953]